MAEAGSEALAGGCVLLTSRAGEAALVLQEEVDNGNGSVSILCCLLTVMVWLKINIWTRLLGKM